MSERFARLWPDCEAGGLTKERWLQEFEKKRREEERVRQLDDMESHRAAVAKFMQKVFSLCASHFLRITTSQQQAKAREEKVRSFDIFFV